MSISFCDMVDYTSLGEALTAAGVVHLLNRHFALQAEAIQARDGVVDKFMGDAVMAFWGPPFTPEALQAVLACRAALDQVAAVERFRSELPDLTGMRRNLPVIGIRIGLSTGDVVVGNIGSATTRSYTVIGDAVNLASRIEHANRLYGTRVLICGVTRALAGDAVVAREIDAIVVKGKTEVTTVHELIGMSDDVADDRQALVRQSEAALAAYRVQDWQSAESGFRACLDLEPNDPVAQVFLARIDAFRQSPPPPEWRGIWILDRK
jgi:adenylate cyclase